MSDDVVLRPRNGLSLCSGGGGLDMGLMLAEPGFHTRCFVEWEEYPRSVIAAAQRAGYFAPAPIWDDLTTFDGRPFRGAFDTILAGYPCQPFSAAGKRQGADDPRHLWPHVARVIREVEPVWVLLENVAGHVSLGAETVLRELWDMGWTPAAGIFSAAEVGAPHERQRWFCVAYRLRDRASSRAQPHAPSAAQSEGRGKCSQSSNGDRPVDDAPSPRCDATGIGAEADSRGGECLSGDGRAELAHASLPRPQGREQPGAPGERDGPVAPRSAAERRGLPLFPPGPGDAAAWGAILRSAPDMAPSASARDLHAWARRLEADGVEWWQAEAEPEFCRLLDGLADRSSKLRLLGNGVVPLCAAYAWRTLSSAHGMEP